MGRGEYWERLWLYGKTRTTWPQTSAEHPKKLLRERGVWASAKQGPKRYGKENRDLEESAGLEKSRKKVKKQVNGGVNNRPLENLLKNQNTSGTT